MKNDTSLEDFAASDAAFEAIKKLEDIEFRLEMIMAYREHESHWEDFLYVVKAVKLLAENQVKLFEKSRI